MPTEPCSSPASLPSRASVGDPLRAALLEPRHGSSGTMTAPVSRGDTAETHRDTETDTVTVTGKGREWGGRDPRHPPPDKGYLVLWCFLFLGTSYLLPFFSFTSAVDYFGYQLPAYQNGLNSIIALVYNAGAFIVFVPVFLLSRKLTYTGRILVTFSLDCVILCVSPFVKYLCAGNENAAFIFFCLLVFLTGCCASVIDSAVMSLATSFPTSYVAATMIGIGVSSILITSLRMIFIVSMGESPGDLEKSAAIYFAMSAGLMLVAMALYMVSRRTPFFIHYAKSMEKSKAVPYSPDEESDESLKTLSLRRNYSGVSVNSNAGTPVPVPRRTSARLPPANPRGYERQSLPHSSESPNPMTSGQRSARVPPADSSEDALNEREELLPKASPYGNSSASLASMTTVASDDFYFEDEDNYSPPSRGKCSLLKETIRNARKGWQFIQGPAVALFSAYCFSTVLFPGFLSEVPAPGGWNPDLYTVSNLFVWNAADFAGRLTCRWLKFVTRSWLVPASFVRMLLFPAFLFCVNPYWIRSPAIVYLLCICEGYSNGVLGTLSFTMSFKSVTASALETAGIINSREKDAVQDSVGTFMSFVLNLGLIVGGGFGVLLTKLTA